MNKYEEKIAKELLNRYYKRVHKYDDISDIKRISVKVSTLLPSYDHYNVDLEKKNGLDQSILKLSKKKFVEGIRNAYSGDFEKVNLNLEHIVAFEQYAAYELNLTPRSFAIKEIEKIIKKFEKVDGLVDFYLQSLDNKIYHSNSVLEPNKEEDILKLLAFIAQNNQSLYIREVSMKVFGESKKFEHFYKQIVQKIVGMYYSKCHQIAFDEDENYLAFYNIYDLEQEIYIKGNFEITIQNQIIDISCLSGGLLLSIKDLDKITLIKANADKIMTVENKTTFMRIHDASYCLVYLSGFANKQQISFLKKIIEDNPNHQYLHFGDIDAGGFWIHKKLCEQSDHKFELFHMGIEELQNEQYASCLLKLSLSDCNRLASLREDARYHLCIDYMLKKKVKLEQEIISLDLFQDES